MTDSNNILTATLADLKTYFEGWHTSEYDALHTRITEGMKNDINQLISQSTAFDNKYAPIKHAINADTYGLGTNDLYGHVKTINNLNRNAYTTGEALSAYQGYILNNKINTVSKDIDNLKTPTVRIGRMRGLNDNQYDEIENSIYGDGVIDRYVSNNHINWGFGKIETDFNPNNPDRLIIQILDSSGNPITQANGKVFVLLNNVWRNLTIGEYNGAGNIRINFAETSNLANAILFGDQWFFVDIFLYDVTSDTNQIYKGVHKKILLNYGRNLWDTYVKNGEIKYNNNGKPYNNNSGQIIDGSNGILNTNNTYGGIYEKINNDSNEKGYYRWERDAYPYGRPKKFPQTLGSGYA